MRRQITVHLVHPGNPFSPDADGIVSVQRNFVRAAPEDFAFRYWGVRRPGIEEPGVRDGSLAFRPVLASARQRPRVPLSLSFAARLVPQARRFDPGILRFDRMESAVPLLRSPLRKVLFLHVWDLGDVVGSRSDSRWRGLGGLYDRVLRGVLGRMDRVFVLRPEVGEQLARRVPSLEGRIGRFGVPVDLGRFDLPTPEARRAARVSLQHELGIPGRARVVVFAGRLEAVKRPEVIPEVAAALSSEVHPVHFLIFGDGSMRDRLERRGEELAPRRVHLLGSAPVERLVAAFHGADACLLPSGFEAIPNVVLESLACGVPVVASSTSGGVAGLIAGRNVGQVAAGEPAAFAAALRDVFAWRGSRASACRQVAEAFAPEVVNEALYEDFRDLAGASRAAVPVAVS